MSFDTFMKKIQEMKVKPKSFDLILRYEKNCFI